MSPSSETQLSCNSALDDWLRRAERIYASVLANGHTRSAEILGYAIDEIEDGNPHPMRWFVDLREVPVTIDEFVESRDFLDMADQVWPALRQTLREMNPDIFTGEVPIREIYLSGATGIGKSTLARISILYQVYLLTCFHDVRRLHGLEPSTIITFPFQSIRPDVTRRTLYLPLRSQFERMPYAQRHLTWNKRKTETLEIEGGIHVVPLVASINSLLGQAIPGALLDEANSMRIVQRSTRVHGPRGLGGHHDQAAELHSELLQRRSSRFIGPGPSIGAIITCSSARYRGDFMDRCAREIEESGHPHALVRNHKRYEVAPPDRYSGETFQLIVGDHHHRTSIVEEGEEVPEGAVIENVPTEHRHEFERNPESAQLDILGIPVDSFRPFISQREKIDAAFDAGIEMDLWNWLENPNVVLDRDGLPDWDRDAIPEDGDVPRYVHIDLSLSHDSCGIAIVKFLEPCRVPDPETGIVEVKPCFAVEAAISIQPSTQNKINFGELRSWLMRLVDHFDINIKRVSFDSFQSVEFRQVLNHRNIQTKEISVDRSLGHYETFRDALYDGRITMVESETLLRELVELEFNALEEKIDHPPRGSKDVADAVCGAIANALSTRDGRNDYGYTDQDGDRVSPERHSHRPQGRRRPQGRKRPQGYSR